MIINLLFAEFADSLLNVNRNQHSKIDLFKVSDKYGKDLRFANMVDMVFS